MSMVWLYLKISLIFSLIKCFFICHSPWVYSSNFHTYVSITYYYIFLFIDLENLNELISKEENITIEWLLDLENINENLLKENMKTQDILFVDVLDTYRNLPLKLLQFYRWWEIIFSGLLYSPALFTLFCCFIMNNPINNCSTDI